MNCVKTVQVGLYNRKSRGTKAPEQEEASVRNRALNGSDTSILLVYNGREIRMVSR